MARDSTIEVNVARVFVILGSLIMMVGVGAGAFGAHGLSSYFENYPDLGGTYDTAVRYLIYHGLALFAAAYAINQWEGQWANWAGYLFLVGILLFSGSLFLLVFTRLGWFGAITPLGGFAFLAGWFCLAVAAWRG
jgi:uncharacterized membrane protein YgdD (TMEM256/DUF423 family)